MPLKHFTETFLIILLGMVIVLSGVLVSTLPPLSEGVVPWLLIFVASLLYPFLLYPMLRSNRADYAFRGLHFLPAAILLLWFLIQLLLLKFPSMIVLYSMFTWGFACGVVVLSFVLLFLFCLHVIRRREQRLFFLSLLLVPFVAFGISSEQLFHGEPALTALVWHGSWWKLEGDQRSSGKTEIAFDGKDVKNLSHSPNPEEEAWRQKLRALQKTQEEVHTSSIGSSHSSVIIPEEKTLVFGGMFDAKGKRTRTVHLARAGVEFDFIVVTLLGLYFGVIHRRVRSRASGLGLLS